MKAVNLLPSELRGASPAPAKRAVPQDSGGPGSYIVLGALALSVAALAGWILTGNTIEQRETDLAAVQERQQAAEARAAKLKPYADFAAVAAERVATVEQLAGSRFRWEQALRDISYAMPENVVVKNLNASIATGTSGGSSPLRGAIAAPAIEVTGCTTDQQSVARMMARLRAVNGVTRVSLSRSDKSENATADGAAAPVAGIGGSDEKPEGCEGKNPPEFELVMFFETKAALSAEPSVTVAAAPGAADAAAQPAAGADPAATPTPDATSSTTTPVSTEEGATP
jgi:Tfp pilus assembly protein PilN